MAEILEIPDNGVELLDSDIILSNEKIYDIEYIEGCKVISQEELENQKESIEIIHEHDLLKLNIKDNSLLKDIEGFDPLFKKNQHSEVYYEKSKIKKSNPSLFKCNIGKCTFSCFENSKRIKKHNDQHEKDKDFYVDLKYKCEFDHCDWAFASELKLKRHLTSHVGKKMHKCELCDSHFSTVYNMKIHMKSHSRPLLFKCQYQQCIFATATQKALDFHGKVHGDSSKTYLCPIEGCSKTFYSSNTMGSHKRSHFQKVNCTICNKQFPNKSKLDIHYKFHLEERPYKCPVQSCSWSFKIAPKLRRHLLTHTNLKSYICSYANCSKAFRRKEHLTTHYNSHTGSKPYKCPREDCSSCFGSKSSLFSHKKRHEIADLKAQNTINKTNDRLIAQNTINKTNDKLIAQNESDSYKSDSGDHYVSSIRSIDNYITTNSSNVSSHIYSENNDWKDCNMDNEDDKCDDDDDNLQYCNIYSEQLNDYNSVPTEHIEEDVIKQNINLSEPTEQPYQIIFNNDDISNNHTLINQHEVCSNNTSQTILLSDETSVGDLNTLENCYYNEFCVEMSAIERNEDAYSYLQPSQSDCNVNDNDTTSDISMDFVSVLSDSSDISDLECLLPNTNLNPELVDMISRSINLQYLH